MALLMTVTVPSGATNDAGAKKYAPKFPSSPKTMRMIPAHHIGLHR